MTMLDRMRRHKGWLKWSLGLVVVTFILLYIPDFLSPQAGDVGPNDVLASIEGRRITAGQFRTIYYQQLQAYRAAYGGNMSDDLIRQLGLDQRLLQQMIDEEAALAEASELGLSASDAELRERILSMPAFQENGVFIGDARYQQILQLQNPPMRPKEFEEQLRRGLVIDKLRLALTEWVSVSDADVDAEFRRRNEKVKLELVSFSADKFREGLEATDEEIAARFEENKERYRLPERRRIRHVLVDMQAMRESMTVPPAEIERYYNDNIDQFSTPEQVQASHILLKTEGKDVEEVRKAAEAVLEKVKAGGDFAALASQYSEDEASAANGGDLGFFGRDAMVPEFEQAAFAQEAGQVSDLVQTQYGFHIIKVTDKRAAVVKPLDEVKTQIEDQLKWERAQNQAMRLAESLSAEIAKPADLETVAKQRGLPVGETGLFDREEPIAGIGFAPEVNAWAFQLTDDQVSPPIRTSQGFVIVAVSGREDARIPSLDEVKDKVREDVIAAKALAAARAKADTVAAAASANGDLGRAAKAADVEVKTTELLPRGTALPDVGVSPAVDEVAFDLPAGGVSGVIETPSAAVVVKVVEKENVTDERVAAGRETLRQELLADRRNRFFTAYMTKAKQRMRIEINRDALQSVIA